MQPTPLQLLNPKAAKKEMHLQGQESSKALAKRPRSSSLASEVDPSSMIERAHGVQRREDQPRKKPRIDLENGKDEEPSDKTATFGGSTNGSLGAYIKEKQNAGRSEAGPAEPIDLTADDDDDDVIVVSDTGNREVCIGKLDPTSSVNIYMIPTPAKAFSGSSTQWPAIKVELRRRPDQSDFNMSAVDPAGNDFGKPDVRTAMMLCPLLGASATNGLRLDAKIEARRKISGEIPGRATSGRLNMTIHMFCPKKQAKGIAKWLSQRQVYLREPNIPLKGTEYYNPQDKKSMKPLNRYTGTSTQYGTVSRTTEEINADLQSMFDSISKSEDFPEAEQDESVLTPLLSHQKQALHFMSFREEDGDIEGEDYNSLWKVKYKANGEKNYVNIITSQNTRTKPSPVRGGILADMMGLGKTLSILSLVVGTLKDAQKWSELVPPQNPGGPFLKLNSKATLLVAPKSTLSNWEQQISQHIQPGTLKVYIYHGTKRTKHAADLGDYDVVLTNYETAGQEFKQARPLNQVNWFRIVLDEAHEIRNQATAKSQEVCALSAQRRWAVTGTPVQNSLEDLGALIKFLRIKPFDDKIGFNQHIMAPFKSADPGILAKLRVLVDSITLRRLKDRIDLPDRNEYTVKLQFTPEERRLYEFFARDAHARFGAMTNEQEKLKKGQMAHVLGAILRLRLLCAHGSDLLSDEEMKLTQGSTYGNAIDIGDDDDDLDEEKPALVPKQAYDMLHLLKESDMDHCGLCDKLIGSTDEAIMGYMTPCYQMVCPDCIDDFKERIKPKTTPDNHMTCPLCEQYVRASFFELTQVDAKKDEEARERVLKDPKLKKRLSRYGGPHTKVKALIEQLQKSEAWSAEHPEEAPIKSVVFSEWTSYLDLISIALENEGLTYTRLDGSMSRPQRSKALEAFSSDPAVRVMLVSIKAGGLGLNLTSASKAYVMEPQWNPAAEAQAVDRIHRLGQTRAVEIVHYLMDDSFEEKVWELQEKKRTLAELSVNRSSKLLKEEAARKRLEDLRSLFK